MHSESFKQHWALSKEDLPLGYNLQKALPAAGSTWIGAWRQSKTIPTNAWASVGVCLRVSACVFLLTAVPSCEAEMTYYPESASGHGRKRIHAYCRRLYRREAKLEPNQGPSVWVHGKHCLCTARFSSCFVWLPLNGSHYQPHATTYHIVNDDMLICHLLPSPYYYLYLHIKR